jgi:hypothetical protein
MQAEVTIADLKELLRYDPETGALEWRSTMGRRRARAGYTTPRGYVKIGLYGREMYAHRVAWAIHHGEWPSDCIDHINCNKSDNRMCNLRIATVQQNNCNRQDFLGVSLRRQKGRKPVWIARVKKNNLQVCVGRFSCFGKARRAYVESSRSLHGEFSGTIRGQPTEG